jgi:hypothetical protein
MSYVQLFEGQFCVEFHDKQKRLKTILDKKRDAPKNME